MPCRRNGDVAVAARPFAGFLAAKARMALACRRLVHTADGVNRAAGRSLAIAPSRRHEHSWADGCRSHPPALPTTATSDARQAYRVRPAYASAVAFRLPNDDGRVEGRGRG
jgi:hypothetical protein